MVNAREGYLSREQAAVAELRSLVNQKQNDLAKLRLQIGQLKRDGRLRQTNVSVHVLTQHLPHIPAVEQFSPVRDSGLFKCRIR